MNAPPSHIKIFLSGPGDTNEERDVVRATTDKLIRDPGFRGKFTFALVDWSQTPLLANMTPQKAIDEGLPLPSQCEIVIVIIKSRMGTPLPYPDYIKPNGEPFLSGTEWEFHDALQFALQFDHPRILVYRCAIEPVLSPRDPQIEEKIKQWKNVEKFFATFTDSASGVILYGYNEYQNVDDFSENLETHLRATLQKLIMISKPNVTGDEAGYHADFVTKARFAYNLQNWQLTYQFTRDILLTADNMAAVDTQIHFMRLISLVKLGHINATKRSFRMVESNGTPDQKAFSHLQIAKHYLGTSLQRRRKTTVIREHLKTCINIGTDSETVKEAISLLKELDDENK